MAVSDSQRKAIEKWDREKVDSLHLRVKKGMRETLQAHAEKQGESVNAFINRAIAETMDRDNAEKETSDPKVIGCRDR